MTSQELRIYLASSDCRHSWVSGLRKLLLKMASVRAEQAMGHKDGDLSSWTKYDLYNSALNLLVSFRVRPVTVA